jgi:hypothetical protein
MWFKEIKIIREIGKPKAGCQKIQSCRESANHDGLQYFGMHSLNGQIDSTESWGDINSMFRWCRAAATYYVYLSDIPSDALCGMSIIF